jgi:hypothetical protein
MTDLRKYLGGQATLSCLIFVNVPPVRLDIEIK